MAKIYIDVGAQRIQTWISKARKLKLVRGGSILLTETTKNNVITEWLKKNDISEFAVSEEAGDIDGVVVLAEETSGALTKNELEQQADEICGQLLLHLNEQLPGVEWAGWRCAGATFLEAFQKAVIQEQPDKRYYLEPSTSEFSAMQLCDGCKAEPAIYHDKKLDKYYGTDCLGRLGSAEEQPDNWLGVEWPSDFEELALTKGSFSERVEKETPQVKKRLRNHVATICADGNRIGAFFEELSRHSKLAGFKEEAIELLDQQTQQAIEEAAFKIQGESGKAALIPHYQGGDDVLVSVTADEAWNFAAHLVQEFEKLRDEYKKRLREVKCKEGLQAELEEKLHGLIDQISLGVGIVFSHHKYPFYACRLKGEEALSKAKQKTKGERSAICWMDLTEDGGDSLYTQAIHFIDFQTVKEQLLDVEDDRSLAKRLPVVIRSLNKTAQNNLSNQWYAWISDEHTCWDEDREKFKEYINAWAKRTGRVEEEITLDTLEEDLHRARWWPYIASEANSEKEQSGSREN